FGAKGLLSAGVAPARTSPCDSCTTAAPNALAAAPAIPNARITDEKYRPLALLIFSPLPALRVSRYPEKPETTQRPGVRPAVTSALRAPGLRREIRGAGLRWRRVGYSLSALAAEITLRLARRIGDPTPDGRGFP